MKPGRAQELFERFCFHSQKSGTSVETGRFRAEMLVELANDGPVTLLIDTKKLF